MYHHISSADYISHMHLALEIQHEDFLILEVTKQKIINLFNH